MTKILGVPMRSLPLRRTAALATASVLLAALTACGGDDSDQAADEPTTADSSAAADPSAEAPADTEGETEDAGEDEVAEGEEVDKEEFLADFKASMENATTARMEMTTGVAETSLTAQGEVDYTTTPPEMAMTMTNPAMGNEAMDIRLVDGFFYINMGQLSQDKFFRVDISDKNSPMGDMSQLSNSLDPVKSFEQFAAGLETVTFVGAETVRGDDADHYVLELDTTKIAALEEAGAQGLPETLEYDLWLDDEDRMRQVQLTMGEMGSVDMQIFDWDEQVEIEAPPAGDVTEMPGG